MKIKNLVMILGFSIISACASNEASMDADENSAEMTKDESTAAVEESKADMQEMKEDAKEETAEASAEMTEAAAAAESEVMAESASASEAATTASNSDNRTSTCTNGDSVRVITVVYDNDATDTVCEVNYEKSSGVQTLWSANSERDYCLDKATAFVQKQEGWGWTCSNLE